MPDLDQAATLVHAVRRSILEQSHRANVGHIGSALSIADIVAVLFGSVLELDEPDRDRFVLSKGHAALALYGALAHTGRLDVEQLDTFCGDGTLLGVHPEAELDGVDFCTGSLGQGLSLGVGCALAARLQGSGRRTFVVMSDAELNEGSVWEAIMLAGHHRLDSLTLVIDLNGQQALGFTKDVIALGAVEDKLAAFGWDAVTCDGHDHAELSAAIDPTQRRPAGKPRAVVAHTTFGKGVSFMESKIEWHYLPLNAETHATAIDELDAALEAELA
jgi:transketolase